VGLGVAPHTELMSLGRRQENDLGCYYPMPMDRLTLFPGTAGYLASES